MNNSDNSSGMIIDATRAAFGKWLETLKLAPQPWEAAQWAIAFREKQLAETAGQFGARVWWIDPKPRQEDGWGQPIYFAWDHGPNHIKVTEFSELERTAAPLLARIAELEAEQELLKRRQEIVKSWKQNKP